MKQDRKIQIPGVDLTFADGRTGRIWGTSGLHDLKGESFRRAAEYLAKRARQDEAFDWKIIVELDQVITSAVTPLFNLMKDLNDIAAEKSDRRSIEIEWHVRPGDDSMRGLGTGLQKELPETSSFSFKVVDVKKPQRS